MLAELNEVPMYNEMHQGIGEHPCDVVDIRGRFISPCFSGFGANICKSVSWTPGAPAWWHRKVLGHGTSWSGGAVFHRFPLERLASCHWKCYALVGSEWFVPGLAANELVEKPFPLGEVSSLQHSHCNKWLVYKFFQVANLERTSCFTGIECLDIHWALFTFFWSLSKRHTTVPKPLRITHPGGSCASKADAVDQNLGEVQRVVSEEASCKYGQRQWPSFWLFHIFFQLCKVEYGERLWYFYFGGVISIWVGESNPLPDWICIGHRLWFWCPVSGLPLAEAWCRSLGSCFLTWHSCEITIESWLYLACTPWKFGHGYWNDALDFRHYFLSNMATLGINFKVQSCQSQG